jgi:excisionase family DNA binding protein
MERMDDPSPTAEELLRVEDVAAILGVEQVTVYRWCRQGRLTCLKPGKSWRIRRTALDAFLRRSERPKTLAGHLGAFFELPDQVLAAAEDSALLTRFDAAFFQAGEARGGLLVKLYEPNQMSRRALAAAYQQDGLDTSYLERLGRLRWCSVDAPEEAVGVLGHLLEENTEDDRALWVNLNWTEAITLETALQQQAALAELVATHPLVVATGVVEPAAETWPPPEQQWQLLGSLRGVIRFARAGLMLSRVVPPPIG